MALEEEVCGGAEDGGPKGPRTWLMWLSLMKVMRMIGKVWTGSILELRIISSFLDRSWVMLNCDQKDSIGLPEDP